MSPGKRGAAALVCGALFGAGLAVSQMINPQKIMNFLDFTGAWDPSLALVMLAALVVTFAGYRLALRRPHPLLENRFHLPTRRDIDVRLLGGAAVFGVGWGLAGYCPGPGIAAMTLGTLEPIVFTIAVLAGFQLHRLLNPS